MNSEWGMRIKRMTKDELRNSVDLNLLYELSGYHWNDQNHLNELNHQNEYIGNETIRSHRPN